MCPRVVLCCRSWQAASGPDLPRRQDGRSVSSDDPGRHDGSGGFAKQWLSCGATLALRGTWQWKASLLEEAAPLFTEGDSGCELDCWSRRRKSCGSVVTGCQRLNRLTVRENKTLLNSHAVRPSGMLA